MHRLAWPDWLTGQLVRRREGTRRELIPHLDAEIYLVPGSGRSRAPERSPSPATTPTASFAS
jgi:hypothetical protein